MAQPEELHRRRVEQIRSDTAERLVAHKQEMQNAAESVARELRDRHGVRVNPDRLLVSE